MFESHKFFYDSMILSGLIGAIVFGGLWATLSKAFEDRVVFTRKRCDLYR
jgi:hypothetical protein